MKALLRGVGKEGLHTAERQSSRLRNNPWVPIWLQAGSASGQNTVTVNATTMSDADVTVLREQFAAAGIGLIPTVSKDEGIEMFSGLLRTGLDALDRG